tara:strand:+ start:1046 stop:1375 length:330 start_codon:yes stop_codon:yes gene_type:complete
MEITSKDKLKNLSLQELKIICKSLNLGITGTKLQLIKNILETTRPEPVVISKIPDSVASPGKKIVGVKLEDGKELRIQLGKEVEKNNAKIIFYSAGVHYYEVDKNFNFL